MIIGRRGRGKSSLCNLLRTGEHWIEDFPLSHLEDSVSADPKSHDSTLPTFPYTIQDTTGFDLSLPQTKIVQEMQNLIYSQMNVKGVLFVMSAGRCDEMDKAVYMLYLQFILSGVPSSMIGVVFTRSTDDCVLNNSWHHYRQLNTHLTDSTHKNFVEALLERCEKKVCFVENSPPNSDTMVKRAPVRKKSLENVCSMVSTFTGSFSFNGIQDLLTNNYKYWSKWAYENPFQVTSGLPLVSGFFF